MNPPDPRQTHELFEAADAGDDRAFDALVARFLPRLHAFVRAQMGAHLRAREGSLDIAQSVCREALEEREDFVFRGEGAFVRWLFTTALNKLRERARHQGRAKRDAGRETPIEDAPLQAYASLVTPSRNAIGREEIERLEAALDRLSEGDREVIALSRIAGLPHAEIAAHLDSTEGAVRNHLGRALGHLGKELRRS